MPEITMPKLSDTMEEGKILRWLKRPGEIVSPGDVLVEVETDKADMEVEAEHGGVLREIRLKEGETASVGTVIAVVSEQDEADPSSTTPPAAGPSSHAPRPEHREPSVAPPPGAPPIGVAPRPRDSEPPAGAAPSSGRPVKISPLARTRAAELGIDPTAVEGTGPAGRITRRDVEEAHRLRSAAPPSAAPDRAGTVTVRPPPRAAPGSGPEVGPTAPGARRVPLSPMRASIARRMSESKREAPHFYVTAIANMDRAVELRAALKATGGAAAAVTYNHLVLKACAEALVAVPEMNARFVGDAIEVLPEVNLGVATAVPDGLIVPVIHQADRATLFEIAARARVLAEKAHQRSFSGDDLSGATFSVSNLGMYEVESFIAVINPPHAGILAVGSVAQRPVVEGGEVRAGYTMHLTVSCDHRAVDGARAAEFLREIRQRLENPVAMLVPREGS